MKQHIYTNFEDFYQNDFPKDHNHPINRLLHFIGINGCFVLLLLGIINFNLIYIVCSLLPFFILSAIGHKLIQGSDILSQEDKKYGIWPFRAAFSFTYRVWIREESLFEAKKQNKEKR